MNKKIIFLLTLSGGGLFIYFLLKKTTLTINTTPFVGEIFVNGVSWGMAPQTRKINIGNYIISFGDIGGFEPPKSISINLIEKEIKMIEGKYTEIPLEFNQIREIMCEGHYEGHLQGITTNKVDAIYWSFTTTLVKTDFEGNIIESIPVPSHIGDPTYHDGKIYAPYSDKFNEPGADSRIFIYDADDLSLIDVKNIPQVTYGAGTIEYYKGHFFVAGGLPVFESKNYIYEYDKNFKYITTHHLDEYTYKGIQTMCYFNNNWWFGVYEYPNTIRTDDSFNVIERRQQAPFDSTPYGIFELNDYTLMIGKVIGDQGKIIILEKI